jgi:hypothetical protein
MQTPNFGRHPSRNSLKRPLNLEQLEARMLMAVDTIEAILEHSGDQSKNYSEPNVQSHAAEMPVVGNSLAGKLSVPGGGAIASGATLDTASGSLQIQLSSSLSSQVSKIRWTVVSTDRTARVTVRQSGSSIGFTFNKVANYQLTAQLGKDRIQFNVRFSPAPTSLRILENGQPTSDTIDVSSASRTLTVEGLDGQLRRVALSNPVGWSVVENSNGGQVTFQTSGTNTRISFDRGGSYLIKVASGRLSKTLRLNVAETLTSISVAPSTTTVAAGQSVQFSAAGLNQFGNPMASQPQFNWTATGGRVDASGLFTAGQVSGTFRVTAISGNVSGFHSLTVSGGSNNSSLLPNLQDLQLRGLVSSLYADNSISREDMIQLLRSVGADNIVTAGELADLRTIAASSLNMTDAVRGLTRNAVHDNPANLLYRGAASGNLAAGSNSTVLNNLINTWFLGTDLPTLTSTSYSYRIASGSLFPADPSFNDSRQGMLGDCYFLASMISIGVVNQVAIRSMFTENSDGTVTVRFYQNGVADYLTVDRQLPSNSSGNLVYSGYGRSLASSSTATWLALAEKAYAQWNETGKTGRSAANSYSAIEGGWMGNVNAQILGRSSSNYAVSGSNKQILVNSLSSGRAVTIGTNPGASAGGLVGSHAYVVTGYNASTDTFSFYNPWSMTHPTNLKWDQLVGQTSYFVVADAGSGGVNGSVRMQTVWATPRVESTSNDTSPRLEDSNSHLPELQPMTKYIGTRVGNSANYSEYCSRSEVGRHNIYCGDNQTTSSFELALVQLTAEFDSEV